MMMLLHFLMLFRSRLKCASAYLHLKCLHSLTRRVTSGQLGMGDINVCQAQIHLNEEKSTESKFLLGNVAS